MQVLGTGLIAAATDGVRPVAWRAAFLTYDTDEDLVLNATEMSSLALALLRDGKLPGRLQGAGALQAAMAPHDANRDGAFSYDEYMDALAAVNRAEVAAEEGAAPLQSACTFGPVLSEGVSGWSEAESAGVRTRVEPWR